MQALFSLYDSILSLGLDGVSFLFFFSNLFTNFRLMIPTCTITSYSLTFVIPLFQSTLFELSNLFCCWAIHCTPDGFFLSHFHALRFLLFSFFSSLIVACLLSLLRRKRKKHSLYDEQGQRWIRAAMPGNHWEGRGPRRKRNQ